MTSQVTGKMVSLAFLRPIGVGFNGLAAPNITMPSHVFRAGFLGPRYRTFLRRTSSFKQLKARIFARVHLKVGLGHRPWVRPPIQRVEVFTLEAFTVQ